MDHIRIVDVAEVYACPSGHITLRPTGERAMQVKHSCGGWTWQDANFCVCCGGRLKAKE